jgi:transposase-like protein
VKKRHQAEEVVKLVREAEAQLAGGKPVEEVCRDLGISESTLVRWRQRFGGMSTPEAKRLRELERENSELKHIVAELELDKRILKSAIKHLGKA